MLLSNDKTFCLFVFERRRAQGPVVYMPAKTPEVTCYIPIFILFSLDVILKWDPSLRTSYETGASVTLNQ